MVDMTEIKRIESFVLRKYEFFALNHEFNVAHERFRIKALSGLSPDIQIGQMPYSSFDLGQDERLKEPELIERSGRLVLLMDILVATIASIVNSDMKRQARGEKTELLTGKTAINIFRGDSRPLGRQLFIIVSFNEESKKWIWNACEHNPNSVYGAPTRVFITDPLLGTTSF